VVTAGHFWAARPDDVLGLGIAWGHVGEPYRATLEFDGTPATSAETLVELTWRAEVAPWLALVPNVQFIADPGALQGVDDSWVVGLRFEISQDKNWPLAASRAKPADGSYARRD
jgi:porin